MAGWQGVGDFGLFQMNILPKNIIKNGAESPRGGAQKFLLNN